MNFFEVLAKYGQGGDLRSYTVVSGINCGERVLFSGGRAVFISHHDGLLITHTESLANVHAAGIFPLEGSLVYAENPTLTKNLVICGAGHVSMPVIRIAKILGLHVTVIDDRDFFVENALLAGADEVISGEFAHVLGEVDGDYFVIVTRGHEYDFECLREILRKSRAYVGMMGSSRRVEIVRTKLLAEGFNPDDVESLHAPIGLAIKARTPAEIALSILAEIVQVQNQSQQVIFPEEVLRFILEHEHSAKVLCTIVGKEGAGPREVGAKMLCTNSGTIGTIGGGMMEAEILHKAEQILRGEVSSPVLMKVELNAEESSRDGEVCGGVIHVFLELLS